MAPRSFRKIDRATDHFQLLEALRTNRQKRERQRRFIVEGVRNIDAALAHGWEVQSVLVPPGDTRSRWAQRVIDHVEDRIELAPELFDRLTDRDDRPELLVVCAIPPASDVPATGDVVVLDRIASPGNLGTIIRTADAFGFAGVVTVGHGASPYDPRCVRASTGSLFAVPVVHVPSIAQLDLGGRTLVATDEDGDVDLRVATVERPCAVLLGSEERGLSKAMRDAADLTVRIPMRGTTASSLNVAVAAGIVMAAIAS
jgi:TrmH family RNA methyltransferase